MALVYAVMADSEAEVAAELDRLCHTLGLEPLGRPMEAFGRARWMARAAAPITPVPERS
jgi:hypothetical protein